MVFNDVWACATNVWAPKIGDPGIMGWLIVALYIITAMIALTMLIRGVFPVFTRRPERIFWGAITLLMLALAVNKQMDLQSLFTALARCHAQINGWYEGRRNIQIGFIIAVFMVMLIVLVLMWRALVDTLPRNAIVLIGLIFVFGFVAIRAAGFHGMDRLINIEIANFRLNWLLEMAGPLMIILGAGLQFRKGSIR